MYFNVIEKFVIYLELETRKYIKVEIIQVEKKEKLTCGNLGV